MSKLFYRGLTISKTTLHLSTILSFSGAKAFSLEINCIFYTRLLCQGLLALKFLQIKAMLI